MNPGERREPYEPYETTGYPEAGRQESPETPQTPPSIPPASEGRPGDGGKPEEAGGEELRRELDEHVQRMKDRGLGFLLEQKDWAADEIDHFSAAVSDAAHRLHEEKDDGLARVAERLAERLDNLAQYLHECDVEGLRRDAEQLVRRQPGLAIGSMFLAGLAVARFLKASPRETRPHGRVSTAHETSIHRETFEE